MPDPSLIQEPDFQQAAEDLQESYKAQQGQNIPRAQVLPPREATDPLVDATNIMFGDFGKALGFTLDQKHLRWNVETAKEAWTESPVKSAIEVGLNVAPLAFKAMQGMRAAKLAGVPEDALRVMDLIDETANVANMSEKTKDIAKLQAYQLQRKVDLADKIDSGLATVGEKTINFLDKKFGNHYMEAVDPKVSADYMKNWVESFKTNIADDEKLRNLIVASSKVPDEYGVKFAQYFQNPDKLSEIPAQYHPVAMQMADEMRAVNSQMLKEGIVDADEAKKVGPIWFSLVREGTPAMEAGAANVVLSSDAKTGKTRLLSMPKTYSPSLLNRKMTNEEVGDLLTKKEASQLIEKGDTEKALSLLKDEKYNSATSLLKEGDSFGAIKLLNQDGKIDLSPKNLTNGSLATQKALLETYRNVRDAAIKYGKKGSEITPAMKSSWQSLDNLFGSDRIRRMVGIAKGLDGPVDELGFVSKDLFKEIESIVGQNPRQASAMDMVNFATAIHKVVKTSLSPATHGQNILGNTIFLWNAGVNSIGPEFLGTQRKAWDAIRGMQTAYKDTGKLQEIGDLGKLKSRIGAADISLADELNSPEVNQLIEKSSLLSTEGVHTINKLVDASKEGSVIKMIGALYKKAKPVTKYLDKASDMYMAEDGAAKFAYYLHLRQDGLSRRGALLEVGRRLPMYNTVGDTWQGMRRSFQPWISFPVETARIIKNNMMDYPLRTAMVMQLPHFAQLGSYATMQAMGRPQSYKTIDDRNKQLPQWAQRPSTIMTPFLDKNGDFRHATLDFLPYTSVMPDSTDPDAPFFQKLPILKEPFPIISGLIYAMTGKDAWGRDIPANSTTDKAKTAMINTMGFLSPPLLDKYMFNATDPTMFYRLHQDLGKYPNQYTDKAGDPMFDFFLNSVVGMKSYASSPEQQVANENFKNRDLDNYKARLSKEATGLLKINDTQAAGDKLGDIYQILLQQYKQPDIARRKFNDFIKRFRAKNKDSKVMQGMSIEQLDRQVDLATDRMAFESGSVRDAYIEALRKERANRKGSSSGGLYNPLLPDKPTAPETPLIQ